MRLQACHNRAVAASGATGSEHRERAGALALRCLANPSESGPALPEEEARFVTAIVERWLSLCPAGPLALGPEAAPAISALTDGWDSTAIHALAARPRTVAEMATAVGTPNGDAVEGRLLAMEAANLLATCQGEDGEWRFGATEWLRLAIAPLAAAARLELRHLAGKAAPIAPIDVEAAFLLTLPLVDLSEEISAACGLSVMVPGPRRQLSRVVVLVEQGEITSIVPNSQMDTNTFATGSPANWIDTLIDPSAAELDASGDLQVCFDLLTGLHEKLFRDSETMGSC